jgi:hypothetical protein
MSSAADRIAQLEAEVSELRAQFRTMFTAIDRVSELAGLEKPSEHTRDAARKTPKRRARPGDAEVIPLRRRAR